jgi:hypothetical protein
VDGTYTQAGTTVDGRPYFKKDHLYFFFDSQCGGQSPRWYIQGSGSFDDTKSGNFLAACNAQYGCCATAQIESNSMEPPQGALYLQHQWCGDRSQHGTVYFSSFVPGQQETTRPQQLQGTAPAITGPATTPPASSPLKMTVQVSGHCHLGADGTYTQAGTTMDGRPYFKNDYWYLFFDSQCGGQSPHWIIDSLHPVVFDDTKPGNFAAACNAQHGCCGVAQIESNSMEPPQGEVYLQHQWCGDRSQRGTVHFSTTQDTSGGTTAYDWGSYVKKGPGFACRYTDPPHAAESGRYEAYHAVTYVPNAETCRQFCDELQPCYGFEFDDETGKEHHKGNCEIWVVPINHVAGVSSNFNCYNRTSTYASPQSKTSEVVAAFTVYNLDVLKIGTNATLAMILVNTMKSMVEAELVNATMGTPVPDLTQASALPIKLSIVPNLGKNAAEVHNQVRALGRGQKLDTTTWTTDELQTPNPSLKASITTWLNTFSDLNAYRTGTVNITWSYTTLTALMPSSPTPAPTPAGGKCIQISRRKAQEIGAVRCDGTKP